MNLQFEELENVEEMMSNDDFFLVMTAVGTVITVIITFT